MVGANGTQNTNCDVFEWQEPSGLTAVVVGLFSPAQLWVFVQSHVLCGHEVHPDWLSQPVMDRKCAVAH